MNPFVLPGPEFLFFYVLFAAAVLLLLRLGRRALQGGVLPVMGTNDPYLYACLSGGPAHVIRVALVGLIDRGLLTLSGETAHLARDDAPQLATRRIERKVLEYCEGGASLTSAVENAELLAVARDDYERPLLGLRLVPDAGGQILRHFALAVAVTVLACVGMSRIGFDAEIGSASIVVLILLMGVAIAIPFRFWTPQRTWLGDESLARVQSLFAYSRQRASSLRPGSGSRDVLWLTALFGVAVLPWAAFPSAVHNGVRFPDRSSNGGGAGVAAGCGSSSGGGCDGGGGGGGCGGGSS
jgi:uncharacterized protein (TIGR04222 family)